MLLNRELGYSEFRGFCECVGRPISETEFQLILSKFSSTKTQEKKSSQGGPGSAGSNGENDRASQRTARDGGLTLEGFKAFFVSEIETDGMEEDRMFEWLASLGYDQDLYSIKSRCFMLTFHSSIDLSVSVRDAIQTDLDTRSNLQIVDRFGQELEVTPTHRILYTFSEQILAYSYAIENLTSVPLEFRLDFSSSVNMLYSSKSHKIAK